MKNTLHDMSTCRAGTAVSSHTVEYEEFIKRQPASHYQLWSRMRFNFSRGTLESGANAKYTLHKMSTCSARMGSRMCDQHNGVCVQHQYTCPIHVYVCLTLNCVCRTRCCVLDSAAKYTLHEISTFSAGMGSSMSVQHNGVCV